MTHRIGTGAGFSADRLDPALQLLKHGELDTMVFECVGERTLAFGHRDRQANPARGYNPLLERRLRAVLPLAREHGTRLVTNMGVANPRAAAEATARLARELGLKGLRIAAVLGDEVSDLIGPDTALPEPGCTVAEIGRPYLAANAYLGADAILPALQAGADVVITGRVADPSLFLAPLAHAHGWDLGDWDRMAAGTVVGHLLECAAQVTGGYFADPGVKDVPNLAYVGFPLAEVEADGSAVVTKLAAAGGRVDLMTVKEQLLYEVHDPAAYVTPDVIADFTTVRPDDQGADRVRLGGVQGRARPDQLKVTVAFDGGLLAEAEISYAGIGAVDRARLAGEIIAERMAHLHGHNGELRCDLIGVSALHGTAQVPYPATAQDVRLRCALRADSREQAELLLWEVEAMLCCGPAGGGGYRGQITASVITESAFVDRERVRPSFEMIEVCR
ncbi:MAG: acyclic terpene utilization AtuA family protein [Alphaproteobacteria bacterium]